MRQASKRVPDALKRQSGIYRHHSAGGGKLNRTGCTCQTCCWRFASRRSPHLPRRSGHGLPPSCIPRLIRDRNHGIDPDLVQLIRLSAQRRPSSVSMAVTSRAPRKPARSVGCLSPLLAVNVSIGAVR
jgi:hypothetical protein